MTELEDVLVALAAPDVKTLAKTLKLSSTTGQKDDLVAAILQHSRRGGIGAFFGGGGGNKATCNMIMKRYVQDFGLLMTFSEIL
jgi:methylmalonyl-CoA mutase cobalamin-binding subunit